MIGRRIILATVKAEQTHNIHNLSPNVTAKQETNLNEGLAMYPFLNMNIHQGNQINKFAQ